MAAGLWLAFVLVCLLILPGWALLAATGGWQKWSGLQRWCVAVGLSIAFYPALYYMLRFVAPGVSLSPGALWVLFLVCAAVIVWRLRGQWRGLFTFDRMEWLAVGLLGLTLLTRFWIIRDHPYPAWSDSLHHTLLTQLTATLGRLPFTLEPYAPIELSQYHLGLYALTGSVESFAQVPAYTALLWVSQALNGLCAVGVYLILDRKVGRLGAVVGLVVAGLLLKMPAWYVNWGRFTQESAQAVLLIACAVTWEALGSWTKRWSGHKAEIIAESLLAALLNASVFLLHFRVAAYYLPLLALIVIWEAWRARRDRRLAALLGRTIGVGAGSILLVTPALFRALQVYVATKQATPLSGAGLESGWEGYYAGQIGPYMWAMLGIAVVAMGWAVFRRRPLALTAGLWMAALFGLGSLYLLRIPLLNVTNMSAIEIMQYLPLGLVGGIACEEGLTLLKGRMQYWGRRALLGLLVIGAAVGAWLRATGVEAYRYFVTPADVAAMDWVKTNTPADAVFAINTYFWFPTAPQGTDGGYWLPYFASRRTTAGTMLSGLGDPTAMQAVLEMSQAAARLATDDAALDDLQRLGVSYIYIGPQGNFAGEGLQAQRLSQSGKAAIVYQRDGVTVLKIAMETK